MQPAQKRQEERSGERGHEQSWGELEGCRMDIGAGASSLVSARMVGQEQGNISKGVLTYQLRRAGASEETNNNS